MRREGGGGQERAACREEVREGERARGYTTFLLFSAVSATCRRMHCDYFRQFWPRPGGCISIVFSRFGHVQDAAFELFSAVLAPFGRLLFLEPVDPPMGMSLRGCERHGRHSGSDPDNSPPPHKLLGPPLRPPLSPLSQSKSAWRALRRRSSRSCRAPQTQCSTPSKSRSSPAFRCYGPPLPRPPSSGQTCCGWVPAGSPAVACCVSTSRARLHSPTDTTDTF